MIDKMYQDCCMQSCMQQNQNTKKSKIETIYMRNKYVQVYVCVFIVYRSKSEFLQKQR